MQYALLPYLRCPVTKATLTFQLVSEKPKQYGAVEIMEVLEGLLFSETGLVFPIIDGIPRMLVEAVYDYAVFLQKHLPDYQERLAKLEQDFPGLLAYCTRKNKKTKISFAAEWAMLDINKKDRIWEDNQTRLPEVFCNELGELAPYFSDKTVVDIGCGHGVMTSAIAGLAKLAIGVELSKAVENAYKNNPLPNAWYIQGDVQFLPFANNTFDVLYSSGVIHHTNNTELSFCLIEPVIKSNGKICLWLYHPQKSRGHNFILFIRGITRRLPFSLAFMLLAVFVFPVTFLIKRVKQKSPPNYREEMIALLDAFTPEFRHETTHDVAKTWLLRKQYSKVAITTVNLFGFSFAGEKGGESVFVDEAV